MNYFITIEDLVMNALIERIEHLGKRSVHLSLLQRYGEAIVSILKDKGITAYMILNRTDTEQFLHVNNSLFDIHETKDDIIVTLRNQVATDYLREHYRVRLSLELLGVFVSKQPLAVILKS